MIPIKPLSHYLIFVGFGLLLWLIFLIAIRLIGSSVFSTGNPLLLLAFVLSIPLAPILIIAMSRLTRTPTSEMLIPVVISDITALLMDGLAVGFTDLYGPSYDQIAAAAAYLLWGVGLTLICAVWLSYQNKDIVYPYQS